MLTLLWDIGIIRVAPVKAFPSKYYKQKKNCKKCKTVEENTIFFGRLWALLHVR